MTISADSEIRRPYSQRRRRLWKSLRLQSAEDRWRFVKVAAWEQQTLLPHNQVRKSEELVILFGTGLPTPELLFLCPKVFDERDRREGNCNDWKRKVVITSKKEIRRCPLGTWVCV